MYVIAILMLCGEQCGKALTCYSLGEKGFSPLHQSRKYVHTRVKASQRAAPQFRHACGDLALIDDG